MYALSFLPPPWLMHVAVAAVWLYEGLWCKLLNGEPGQKRIVQAAAHHGLPVGSVFFVSLGILETGIAIWVLCGIAPFVCVVVQTGLLVGLNAGGLLWARHLIHDPAGMVIKNFAFLVLAWTSAGILAWK